MPVVTISLRAFHSMKAKRRSDRATAGKSAAAGRLASGIGGEAAQCASRSLYIATGLIEHAALFYRRSLALCPGPDIGKKARTLSFSHV